MFNILATHSAFDVADLEATKQYLDARGIQKLRELTRPDGFKVVWYPGLELRQVELNATAGIVKHVAWEVDNIEAAMNDLKATGVVFDTETPNQIDVALLDRPDRVQYAFFTTPVGIRGEIVQVNAYQKDDAA